VTEMFTVTTVKIIHCFFYSVCYANGQTLNILNTNVEIFKYKKNKTNFSFTAAVSGRGQNS